MANNQNLKPPWKKGDPSPNPKGKPKGVRSFKTVIRELLADKITIEQAGKEKKITKQQAMVLKQIEKAIATSDTTAFREIVDRMEGKAVQHTDLTSKGDKLDSSLNVFLNSRNDKPRTGKSNEGENSSMEEDTP